MMSRLLWSVLLLGTGYQLCAQRILDIRMDAEFNNVTIVQALNQLIDEHGVSLSFSDNIIPDQRVRRDFMDMRLGTILDELLEDTQVDYKLRGSVIVLYKKDKPISRFFTISGFLEDAESGERLIGATIHDQISGQGTTTNDYGFFSLRLPPGQIDLLFSYIGYKARNMSMTLHEDIRLSAALHSSLTLQEVVVIARDSLIGTIQSSNVLNTKALRDIPRLAGEADLIRMTYLMPGVQTGTDGVEGMHVRGGSAGQNLVLIDGVPVYYVAHAAGIFSIFNADAIRSATLIKGGFPARYGGRLSSILDVRTKEGNAKKMEASAEVGLVSGKVSVEGPLIKDKSSFFLAGRWSFLDWYIVPFSKRTKSALGEKGGVSYRFHDVNGKFNYSLGRKDKLYLSYYGGRDNFLNGGRAADTIAFLDRSGNLRQYRAFKGYYENLEWSNHVGVVRWNHIYNDRLFSNVSATYSELLVRSQYQLVDSIISLSSGQYVSPFIAADYFSSVKDAGLRADFDFYPNSRHRMNFGWSANYRIFNPGVLLVDNGQSDAVIDRQARNVRIASQEYVGFVDNELKLGTSWQLNAGMHLSLNQVEGRSYFSAQPRLGLYGRLHPRFGVKFSLSRMSQFLHLLTNTNLGLPNDLWVPSTADIQPENAWQGAMGLDYFPHPKWEIGVEGYYKKMDHLAAFTEGASFLSDWRNNITVGAGTSQGLELMVRRKQDRLTGWLAYTFSFTDREYKHINLGRRYPYKYDRRHDLKFVMAYKLNEHIDLSADWVISSGFAYSFPESEYALNLPGDFSPPTGIVVANFGDKNDDRMPAYHRFDVGGNYTISTDHTEHRFHLGVYNLYNRRNPLYYSYRTDYVNAGYELRQRQHYVQVKLLPVLPSLSYSIRFF